MFLFGQISSLRPPRAAEGQKPETGPPPDSAREGVPVATSSAGWSAMQSPRLYPFGNDPQSPPHCPASPCTPQLRAPLSDLPIYLSSLDDELQSPGKIADVVLEVPPMEEEDDMINTDTSDEVIVTADNRANLAIKGYRNKKMPRRAISSDDFFLVRVIGKGSYGKVMLVRSIVDDQIYAMKMLRKENIVKRNQVEHTRTERNVMENISHPFIVQLYYAFQSPAKLYFIMEYCPGGELFFHLSRAGKFSEERARFYSAQIVLALEHLHRFNIVYRDLKPENVLLDGEGHIRLTDFGLSKEGILDNASAKSLCGTPEYLAPEILNQTGHGKAVDWWSLGALVYEMLTGLPPFYTRDREKLFDSIRSAELNYPTFISPVAKSLLVGLLQRNPNERLGGGPEDAEEIRHHPFYHSIDWEALQSKQLRPPFKPSLNSDTDVHYFDKEFIKMPAVNSEVQESAAAAAADADMFAGFTYDGRDRLLDSS